MSLSPSQITNDTNVIVIVITRWDSFELRSAIREMFEFGTKDKILKYKLIFLFNLHEKPTQEELTKITQENGQNSGMLLCPAVCMLYLN